MGNCTDPFNVWRNPNIADNVWTGNELPPPLFLMPPQVEYVEDPVNGSADVYFSEELDTLSCDPTLGVTITVNGTPANILSVTGPTGPQPPWIYNYLIDVPIAAGDTVSWSYDANNGCLAAVSGAEMQSFTDTEEIPGGPSLIVSWLEGTGAPIISGPVYTSITANAAVNDSSASTIDTPATATDLLYAEFEITASGTFTGTDVVAVCGWKRAASFSNAGQSQLYGCFWENSSTTWRVNRDALSVNPFTFDVQEAAPTPGTIIGVALDLVAKKIYILMNGNWQTSDTGTVGGDPSGGLGWDLSNTSQIMGLYSSTDADNQTLRANKPQFTPAGYTAVT